MARFDDARESLAESQALMERFFSGAQMGGGAQPEMMQEEFPVEEEIVEETPMEDDGAFADKVKEAVMPMFEELKALITKKEDSPKEAVLKVEGTLEDK